jgi:hypothetical protein
VSDIVPLLIDVAGPLVSAIGGVALAVWRLQHSISERVRDLEEKRKHFQDLDYPREHRELLKAISDVREECQRGSNAVREELQQRAKERAEVRRLQNKSTERHTVLEQRVEQCERAAEEMSTQFQSFAKEQNEQWQAINKSLGQIEGFIRGLLQKDPKFPKS